MRSFTGRGGWWVVGQVVMFAVAVAGAASVDDGFGDSALLEGAGWLLMASGGVLGVAGFAALGRGLTPFPAPLDDAELVQRGAYRLARHPIYGGVALGFVGLGLSADSLIALASGLLLFPYFFAKSVAEERHLLAVYPGYEAYRQEVRKRLLPWLI